jgi:hypothetical protein
MTGVAGVGRSSNGCVDVGGSWSATIGSIRQSLLRLGHDPEAAESILDARGLLPAGESVSANGSCRLLRSADRWLALNLPRTDDLELLPAWLGCDAITDGVIPWDDIAASVRVRSGPELVDQSQELGLAVALVPDEPQTRLDEQLRHRGTGDATRPFLRTAIGDPDADRVATGDLRSLRVVDLSSLWAGPLCSRLLADLGAHVVKVESTTRPDGARSGDPELFARLHAGKEFAAVPFESGAQGAALRDLLAGADVIIEGSRPRALDRLGIDPVSVVSARPGTVWLSITAYGRTGPWRNRVGFGDDAAAAGGLVDGLDSDAPAFVGDAIADPLTGVLAAALVADAVRAGGGVLIDVALREVARGVAMRSEVRW